MGKILEMSREKAWELHDRLQGEAGVRFISQVMEWEGCDFDTARAMCDRSSDPVRPEYSLGWKLADPMTQLAMWGQPGKKARRKAVEDFELRLEPDELELFRRDVLPMRARDKFKAALKRKGAK